ncbi:Golgi apparatus protein 1-like isoform X2 [Saccostrea echinata]|uniref:Golgi apparatus protein 1-like isoform X2 n=1 Tax=Saccostrea echinata TaxID=191078 RepID=UPI002A83D5EA|nr:Golgi apparatus protein 1-like isoform X2 [Saccostrea echinata]
MDSNERRVMRVVMMLRLTVFIAFVFQVNGQGVGVRNVPTVSYKQQDMKLQDGKLGQPAVHHQQGLDPAKENMQQKHGAGGTGRQPGAGKPAAFRLSESRECADDIVKHCNPKIYKNNFAILDCLQNDIKIMEDLSEVCQHFIWKYKLNLTRDDRFDYAAGEVCKQELSQNEECSQLEKGKGLIIPCLVDNIVNITGNCRTYLEKMARIVFSDYRLIFHFVDQCNADIQQFGCGRVAPLDENDVHSQGKTLECLADKIGDLHDGCRKQLLRVAELQADDYHLDRQLYYACREDREHLCADVPAGGGKIYECLFKHKFDNTMSAKCKEMLTVRQQLIAQDVKVEKTFYSACRRDMKEHHCFKKDTEEGGDFRRANILLCLENAIKTEKQISPECQAEMAELRQELMEDYSISPEILTDCKTEIMESCDKGLERGGKTIHCLMDLARPARDQRSHKQQKTMSAKCRRALEALIQEADPASDYRMDRVLQKACEPVVQVGCKHVQPGDARVISCLMDHLDSEIMNDECEERLMEIQYFVARDFRLDPALYKKCHKDAQKLCSAPEDWANPQSMTPDMGPLVLPCLYRHMKQQDEGPKVSKQCKNEIKRVMKQRAQRVQLKPEIEQACLRDLGMHCSESDDPGANQEISCLQEHYDQLDPECQDVIGNFTEDEDEMPELDIILMKACTPMINKFCDADEEVDGDDTDDIMECLIENKNRKDMNEKCRAGIEHHQLISMKNFRFDHKFKEACKRSVSKFCKNRKTKNEVISCLSEHVRNDTLLDEKQRIDRVCRKQLRVEVLERGEDIHLDRKLEDACHDDIKQKCQGVDSGNAKMIECLKSHQKSLSPKCHKVLFKREKEEAVLGDYKVHSVCKRMIKMFCNEDDMEEDEILPCLKKNKDRPEFDEKCHQLIVKREIAENKDYRLNPELQKKCRLDIPKFCSDILKAQKNDNELQGKIVTCLRKKFAVKRLSRECNLVIRDIIKDSAHNYMEDAVLASACEGEIIKYCGDEHEMAMKGRNSESRNKVEMVQVQDGSGKVVECLKQKFLNRIITNTVCKQEIERVIQESQIDINVDPLLHMTCQRDLQKFCGDLEPGEGHRMACLLAELEDHPKQISEKCLKELEKRKLLWELAAQGKPIEGFHDVYQQIVASPSKNYLLFVICSIIGVFFLVGITCGRVSKRVAKQNKMK